MKNVSYILLAVLLGLFTACSTNKFHTTKIQNLDFSQYRTYGWLPPVDSLSKDYFSNDIVKANILDAANKEIEELGLRYTKDNPDVLFRYIAIVNNKNRMVYRNIYHPSPWSTWFYPWGYYPYYNYPIPAGKEKIRFGHIIIEAIDRQNKNVIWQARGTTEVNNPEKAINKLPDLVHGIMKEYPIKFK